MTGPEQYVGGPLHILKCARELARIRIVQQELPQLPVYNFVAEAPVDTEEDLTKD